MDRLVRLGRPARSLFHQDTQGCPPGQAPHPCRPHPPQSITAQLLQTEVQGRAAPQSPTPSLALIGGEVFLVSLMSLVAAGKDQQALSPLPQDPVHLPQGLC